MLNIDTTKQAQIPVLGIWEKEKNMNSVNAALANSDADEQNIQNFFKV